MQAAVGDRLRVHANIVGQPERTGEIVEVRGGGGEPPYLVRFGDGHTVLVFPGPDAIIEHPRGKGGKRPADCCPSGPARAEGWGGSASAIHANKASHCRPWRELRRRSSGSVS